MNYTHLNRLHEHWQSLSHYFTHNFTVTSFEDYIRKISFLPSCKWIQHMDSVKATRTLFVVDPEKFSKKYSKYCVTYNNPLKPEEGYQRVIYQMSPTLHVEAVFFGWMEHDNINSYVGTLSYYNDEKEYASFIKEMYKIKLEGNTEDKPKPSGFAGFAIAS